MASKDTGFHHSDADWTRGRAFALADAEALARRQDGLSRKVTLAAAIRRADQGLDTGFFPCYCIGTYSRRPNP